MGINQLLKALKSITRPRKISEYSNLRVAVDTYSWIHKGLYKCAIDLAENNTTDEYINYCIRKVEQLKSNNITIVMVFDGGKLPMKHGTEEEREKKRRDQWNQACQLKQQGLRDKAQQKFAEAIDVTPLMAHKLLEVDNDLKSNYQKKILRSKNIECIVAPFEADAQLAYLSRIGYVDVIITEDSDLLAFGAKKIFYKMNPQGEGEEINSEDLNLCTDPDLTNWTNNMFLTLCIMSGCDYLDQIPSVGLKTAYTQINRFRNYLQAIDYFVRNSKFHVPSNYVEEFEKAFLTFRFQKVFCPKSRKIITLHELDLEQIKLQDEKTSILEKQIIIKLQQENIDLSFLGRDYDSETACLIAEGKICPITLKPFDQNDWNIENIFQIDKQELINSKTQINQEDEQFQKPQFGKDLNRQVFKLQKSQKKIGNSKIRLKQQSIREMIKPRRMEAQDDIDNLLKQQAENQQQCFTKTLKQFKVPTKSQNIDIFQQKHQYKKGIQDQMEIEENRDRFDSEVSVQEIQKPNLSSSNILQEQNSIISTQENRNNQLELFNPEENIIHTYKNGVDLDSSLGVILNGWNGEKIQLNEKQLNTKIYYNESGKRLMEQIKFDDYFKFSF